MVLDTFGILIDRIKGQKAKQHLCTICVSILRHASHPKIVVRIENYRVVKKLMIGVKPNAVINSVFEHLGDKVCLHLRYEGFYRIKPYELNPTNNWEV